MTDSGEEMKGVDDAMYIADKHSSPIPRISKSSDLVYTNLW